MRKTRTKYPLDINLAQAQGGQSVICISQSEEENLGLVFALSPSCVSGLLGYKKSLRVYFPQSWSAVHIWDQIWSLDLPIFFISYLCRWMNTVGYCGWHRLSGMQCTPRGAGERAAWQSRTKFNRGSSTVVCLLDRGSMHHLHHQSITHRVPVVSQSEVILTINGGTSWIAALPQERASALWGWNVRFWDPYKSFHQLTNGVQK